MNTFSYVKYKDIKAGIRLHKAKLNYSNQIKVEKPEHKKVFFAKPTNTTPLMTSEHMCNRDISQKNACAAPTRDFRKS